MVCMTNPKEGLKGDTKLVKKRREVLEDMGCIVDVLYFEWSWYKSTIETTRSQTRLGVEIVAKISAWNMIGWLSRANSVIANEAVQTWMSFGMADMLKKRIGFILGSYTVIHFFHIRSAGLWKLVPTSSKVIVDVIDSYTLNIGNRINKESHKWKRVFLRAEYKRIRRMEANIEKYFANSTKTTIVAVAEADLLHIGSGSSRRVVVPVGISRRVLRRTKRQQGRLRCVFFGNLDYEPNIRACLVIEEAAKILKGKGLERDIEITVAGRNISYYLKKRLKQQNIRVESPVEDMYEVVRRHDLAVMPMVSGSGMQSKVLEAIAWGVVVLTTEKAARPVGLMKDRDYIRINSAKEIVERIIDIANGILPARGPLSKIWSFLVQQVCLYSKKTIVLSNAMKTRCLKEYNLSPSKVDVIHNWAVEKALPVPKSLNPIAHDWQVTDVFTVQYSGNFGRLHEIITLLEAARILADERFHFVFVGDGAKRTQISAYIKHYSLSNVTLKPYQDRSVLPYSLGACDIAAIGLIPGSEDTVAPSKFYGIISSAKPVLLLASHTTDIARLITDNKCGFVVEPGDPLSVANTLRHLTSNPAILKMYSDNASHLYTRYFGADKSCAQYNALITSIFEQCR